MCAPEGFLTAPRPQRFLVVALLAFLAGCRGDLLATAKLSGPGTAEAHLTGGRAVRLWADFNGTWQGSGSHSRPPLAYEVDVVSGEKVVSHFRCTTAGGTAQVCRGLIEVNGRHEGDCEFKLGCELPPLPAGEVTLRVTGLVSEPERVPSMQNMSLNVRAD